MLAPGTFALTLLLSLLTALGPLSMDMYLPSLPEIGRALHAFGLSRHEGTSVGRALGILLTWLMILATSLLAIYSVIFPGRF